MAAKVNIKVLQAREGDCIFITISDDDKSYIIMVDSGVKSTYQYKDKGNRICNGPLKDESDELRKNQRFIDLVILTHVDDDHIGGIIEWIAKDEKALEMMNNIWLNNGEIIIPDYSSLLHTIPKGCDLDGLLRSANKNIENQIVSGKVFNIPFGQIKILSPTMVTHNAIAEKWNGKVLNKIPTDYKKPISCFLAYAFDEKDSSKTNNSSISFLLEVDNRKDLFLGDADIVDVCSALEELGYNKDHPLQCKTVKLSHHGSRNNFSNHFLDIVKSEVFIFSSNGNYHGHPDKEVFSQIIDKTKSKVYFNYNNIAEKIINKQDLEDYPDILNRILSDLNG